MSPNLRTTSILRPFAAALVLVMASVVVVHAVGLGGLHARSLGSWQGAAPSTPTVLTCDRFNLSAPTGTAINGRPVRSVASCGTFTWATHSGTWSISSGRAGASGTNASATLPTTSASITVDAEMTGLASGRIGGLALSHGGTGGRYLAGVVNGLTQVQLRLYNGSAISTLATATTTLASTIQLRVRRSASTVTISVNGTVRLTYTLTAANLTTLGSGTRAGLYASNNSLRFTDFVATP